MSQQFSIRTLDGLAAIPAADWNRLTGGANPFVLHEYLAGLEAHDCLRGHGWTPCHLALYSDEVLAGALPLYARTNSYGEFVFDWAWADALDRAGGKYYPKLTTAIPFAPVMGPRMLVRPGFPSDAVIRRLLAERAVQLADHAGLSSWHCLFTEEPADRKALADLDLLPRVTCQYRWRNDGYRDFQDFLDAMSSKKRKQIRRERGQVREQGIEIEVLDGAAATPAQWRVFYDFYCSTFHRRWGSPRLTLEFFMSLGESLPSRTLLILAGKDGEYVAGAFAMLGDDTLYGRHWGCSEYYSFLHFELCYYQTIDYAIRHGLAGVDAGVQGEHKLSRGFQPVGAISYHYLSHPELRRAVADYLERETVEMRLYLDELRGHLPFKSG